ncbi:sister chromatid cohesion protein PDS5, partial [Klebsiella pneumoniae]|nr:sister chromatid cohesion protein PDS5 [Klebsiella pneumoniae]
TYIVPPNDPSYAQRLHTVTSLLDENERSVFFYLTNLRLSRPTALDVYVESCDRKDSSRLSACIQAIAAILNDPDVPNVLYSFANDPDE